MQITINTSDILGDETSIRQEVIDQVSTALIQSFGKELAKKVSETMESELKSTIKNKLSELADLHLDTEITPVNEYGNKSTPYTLRNKIAEIVASQCVFKPTGYSSDQNVFTKSILKTVETELERFRKEYVSIINQQLVKSCLDDATAKLKAAVGIK